MLDNKTFEDKAWDQMSIMLDKEMPTRKVVPFWRRWYSLLVLFMFCSGTIYMLFYDQAGGNTMHKEHNVSSQFIAENSIYVNENSGIERLNSTSKESENTIKEIEVERKFIQESSVEEPSSNSIIAYNAGFDSPSDLDEQSGNDLVFSVINNSKDVQDEENVQFSQVQSTFSSVSFSESNTSNEQSKVVFSNENEVIAFEQNAQSKGSIEDLPTRLFVSEFPIRSMFSESILSAKNQDKHESLFKESLLPNPTVFNRLNLDFGLVAGLNYYTDFQSLSRFVGFETSIGKRYSRWRLSTGLQYEDVSLNKIETASRELDLVEDNNAPGWNVNESSISIENITQLNIPLTIRYTINRFGFSFGINNSIILSQTGADPFDLSNGSINLNTVDNTLYRVGLIKRISYSFSNSFSTGLTYKYDLSPFNTGFSNESKRLHALGAHLKYTF